MSYVFIDEERVSELARSIDDAAPGAEALATAVQGAFEEAEELDVVTWAHLVNRIPFFSYGPHSSAQRFAQEGPETASEIRRRLEHLAAYDELRVAGYPLDPSLRFEDAEPPSAERIDELIGIFRDAGENYEYAAVLGAAHGEQNTFTAAEIDAAIASLTDGELAAINAQLEQAGRPDLAMLTASWLFGHVSPKQMERLHQHLPQLEPRLDDADRGWQHFNDDLSGYQFSWDEIYQGGLGDCWFLASLGAVSVSSSGHLKRHIRQNPNGSYTVTFYDNGDPVEITVSAYLPDPPYAHDGSSPREPNWAAIYEKAAAVYHGGNYSNLIGRMGSGPGLDMLTGGDSNRALKGFFPSIEQVEEKLAQGKPMTVTTALNWGVPELVSWHVYIVVGVTTNSDGEKVVHLRNPWGSTQGERAIDLYVTESQFKGWFIFFNETDSP